MVVAATDQDNATTLESLVGSIGAVTLGQLTAERRRLAVLDLPGTTRHADDLAAGGDHLSMSLYLAITQAVTRSAQAFVEFVASPIGRRLLAETGHLPTLARPPEPRS
ncbi:MAG: hypothetical protein AAFX81_18420 [Pseudomonadota bacterium]